MSIFSEKINKQVNLIPVASMDLFDYEVMFN